MKENNFDKVQAISRRTVGELKRRFGYIYIFFLFDKVRKIGQAESLRSHSGGGKSTQSKSSLFNSYLDNSVAFLQPISQC